YFLVKVAANNETALNPIHLYFVQKLNSTRQLMNHRIQDGKSVRRIGPDKGRDSLEKIHDCRLLSIKLDWFDRFDRPARLLPLEIPLGSPHPRDRPYESRSPLALWQHF